MSDEMITFVVQIIPKTVMEGYARTFSQSDEYRHEELIRVIERSIEKLTLQELEALYYDMSTKSYINDWQDDKRKLKSVRC